ncbi:unnamed protein product, partial [Ectocarpus sp. 12 AP-2014]
GAYALFTHTATTGCTAAGSGGDGLGWCERGTRGSSVESMHSPVRKDTRTAKGLSTGHLPTSQATPRAAYTSISPPLRAYTVSFSPSIQGKKQVTGAGREERRVAQSSFKTNAALLQQYMGSCDNPVSNSMPIAKVNASTGDAVQCCWWRCCRLD